MEKEPWVFIPREWTPACLDNASHYRPAAPWDWAILAPVLTKGCGSGRGGSELGHSDKFHSLSEPRGTALGGSAVAAPGVTLHYFFPLKVVTDPLGLHVWGRGSIRERPCEIDWQPPYKQDHIDDLRGWKDSCALDGSQESYNRLPLRCTFLMFLFGPCLMAANKLPSRLKFRCYHGVSSCLLAC